MRLSAFFLIVLAVVAGVAVATDPQPKPREGWSVRAVQGSIERLCSRTWAAVSEQGAHPADGRVGAKPAARRAEERAAVPRPSSRRPPSTRPAAPAVREAPPSYLRDWRERVRQAVEAGPGERGGDE
jgi:hypothetical protein